MTNPNLTVADGLVVGIDYTLRLDDDEILDSSEGRSPLEFLQGHGQIISGLEQALYGMAVGDEKDVVVEPADGYGEGDPEAHQEVALSFFPTDMALEPGHSIQLQDESGRVFEAYVSEIGADSVRLDFNHPLAGETLFFHVQIVSMRPATVEELAHGHAHADGHEQ